jgi:hypothetical protein
MNRPRNPVKACKQFTESYRQDHRILVMDHLYARVDSWYKGHGGQDEDANLNRLTDKWMLFTHLELVIGDYCDALKDERWQAMTADDQDDLIRHETTEFLMFNMVHDLNDRGGVD